jgi:hypothetical protein
MEYSDQGFEEFQDLLRPFKESNPLLWRNRDSLYAALYYRVPGSNPGRRHGGGLWLWIAWVVCKALIPARNPVPTAATNARFHFLFCGTHSAHFDTLVPVVREAAALSKGAPACVWSAELKPGQESFLAGIGNVKVVRLPAMPSSVAASTKIRAAFHALCETFALGRMLEETDHRKQFLRSRSIAAETVFHHLFALDFWEKILPHSASGAVFTTTETPAICKGFFAAAWNRDWRAVHFCHGFRHAMHQVTRATDLCVYSELDRKWFRSRVEKDCTVRAIGNPRMETIRNTVGPPRNRKPGETFRLLLFSSGEESPYTAEMVKADLAILVAGFATRSKYILRIRPHPREPLDVLLKVVKEIGLVVDEFSKGTLTEDVSWCDAAATSWSTALLEAAVAGRPCYWTDAGGFGFGGTGELQRAGLGLLVRNSEQWQQAAEEIFSGHVQPPAAVSEKKLQELGICFPRSVSWLQRLEIR